MKLILSVYIRGCIQRFGRAKDLRETRSYPGCPVL